MLFDSDKELIDYVKSRRFDAVVVEGYDGVGKGRVLSMISESLHVTPYRPDYNFWQSHDLKQRDRWKISGFFWDVYSHFIRGSSFNDTPTFLFDRGIISGAVYNNDPTIADDYRKLIQGMDILHILITCSEEDYCKFQGLRGTDVLNDYQKYSVYTEKYFEYLSRSGVEYVVFQNKYDEKSVEKLSKTCEGCGHYSYGKCCHKDINHEVDKNSPRCDKSGDAEVQDDPKVQCL